MIFPLFHPHRINLPRLQRQLKTHTSLHSHPSAHRLSRSVRQVLHRPSTPCTAGCQVTQTRLLRGSAVLVSIDVHPSPRSIRGSFRLPAQATRSSPQKIAQALRTPAHEPRDPLQKACTVRNPYLLPLLLVQHLIPEDIPT